jgi:hypothetical protein
MKIWRLNATSENHINFINRENDKKAYFPNGFFDCPITKWGDVEISFRNKKMFDSIDFGPEKPAFSKRAVEILLPLIEDKVQILPLKHPLFECFVLNVTNIIDVIDYERSTCSRLPSGRIVRVIDYKFKADKVASVDIFKDPYFTTNVYVSDCFRQTVIDNKLTGFKFTELWNSETTFEEEISEPIEWQDSINTELISFSEAIKLAETTGQIFRSGKWRLKFNENRKLEIGEVDKKGQVHYLVLAVIPQILLIQKWFLDSDLNK